jgi:hypothetical protein
LEWEELNGIVRTEGRGFTPEEWLYLAQTRKLVGAELDAVNNLLPKSRDRRNNGEVIDKTIEGLLWILAFLEPTPAGESAMGLNRAEKTAAGLIEAGRGGSATQPNRIYSARELLRRAEEPGPFHNFPESFNKQIFENGNRTISPDFFNKARMGLSADSIQYRLPGTVNGRDGMFEIFTRPSNSGNTEVIIHRFFNPKP